jgi:hypothetical protein
MTVIYKSVNEPVQIKKITIHLWSLNDQVEKLISYFLSKHVEQPEMLTFERVNEFVHETLTTETQQTNHTNYNPAQHDILTGEFSVDPEKKSIGQTFLSDINMDWVAFFAHQNFYCGQSIIMDFQIPRRFLVNAQILECRKINMNSRIIGPNKMLYRIFARFTFVRPGERTNIRNFVKHLHTLYLQDGKIS